LGLLERAFGAMGYERRSAPDDPSWAALGGNIGYASALSARAAENLSTVLACTTAISSALGYVQAYVYRRDTDGTRAEMPTHPLAKLTRTGASPNMTWPDFVEHWVASALLSGNGLGEIVRSGNGQLAGFNWIPWQHVTVAQLSTGRLAFDVNDGRGNSRRLLQSEVIHLRGRTDDGLVGRSVLSRAAETVSSVNSAQSIARKFMENGLQPSGVLETPAAMGPESQRNLRDGLNRTNQGVERAGNLLILGGGMSFKSVSLSPEDAELLESRKFGVVEICRLFHVPPPIVQAYENNTFTNANQAGIWFATYCLGPWARKIQAEFARSVLAPGIEMELDLSGFLQGDPLTRWQTHQIAIETNVLDANEIRQIEGYNTRAESATAPPAPLPNSGSQQQ
jgi:HK97 family phage portal protein